MVVLAVLNRRVKLDVSFALPPSPVEHCKTEKQGRSGQFNIKKIEKQITMYQRSYQYGLKVYGQFQRAFIIWYTPPTCTYPDLCPPRGQPPDARSVPYEEPQCARLKRSSRWQFLLKRIRGWITQTPKTMKTKHISHLQPSKHRQKTGQNTRPNIRPIQPLHPPTHQHQNTQSTRPSTWQISRQPPPLTFFRFRFRIQRTSFGTSARPERKKK